MKILKFKRTLKEGWDNFGRNGWLSFATVSIMTLSLYVVSATVMVGFAASAVLDDLQNKINVSVYFNPDVSEEEIFVVRDELQQYREVKTVEYVSRESALDQFLAEEKDDPTIREAIDELGENPLLASLVITAYEPSEYDVIVSAIETSYIGEHVANINFQKNKERIDRLNDIVSSTQKIGIGLISLFVFIAALITFNTIRITLYANRQAFEVMRLVGASNAYVRMPPLLQGILYGFFGAGVALIFLAITAFGLSQFGGDRTITGNDTLFTFFLDHFLVVSAGTFFFGILLGSLSSFIAIARYLKK